MACHPQTFVNLEVLTCEADVFDVLWKMGAALFSLGLIEFKGVNLGCANLSASKCEVPNNEEIKTRCF